jgi:hypothetical protein
MIEEIKRLYRQMGHSRKRFNHFYELFRKLVEESIITDPNQDNEFMLIALEYYSSNAIKIIYEMFNNQKLSFFKILNESPVNDLFVFHGVPEEYKYPFDLVNASLLIKRKNKDYSSAEKKTIELFQQLREIRDKVICHCDPDNFEVKPFLESINNNVSENVRITKNLELYLKNLKHRKSVIDKYYEILNKLYGIMISNEVTESQFKTKEPV